MEQNHGGYTMPSSVAIVLLVILVLSSGCMSTVQSPPAVIPPTPPSVVEDDSSWTEIPLTDMQGKGNFSIRSFVGKTVLIPVVSDGCPSCIILLSRQLGEIDRLPEVHNGRISVVALDLDPPIGPGFIAAYHDQFNFSGYSARSPPEMTSRLFEVFGIFVVETDAVPVILVCPDGHALLLPTGVKSTESLTISVDKEC